MARGGLVFGFLAYGRLARVLGLALALGLTQVLGVVYVLGLALFAMLAHAKG